MPKQPKPGAPKLSKEQVAQQFAEKARVEVAKKIARERVYPVLQKAGSIHDAQRVCEVLKTIVMSKMNAYWMDKTVADLGLIEELTSDESAQDIDVYRELLESISDLKISDAQKHLEGMDGALGYYVRKTGSTVLLADVPVGEVIYD